MIDKDNTINKDNMIKKNNTISKHNTKYNRINKKTNKNSKIAYRGIPIHESVLFGVLLAIVGGFLDAYTYIGRDGVFANAQTGNIVLVSVYAAQGNWGKALLHIPPILAFILGVLVTEMIKAKSNRIFLKDWKRGVLILEVIVLFIVGFIPYSMPDIIVIVIISFVTSVQVQSFRTLVNSPYATTMCTGNLRSASQEVFTALTKHDREAAKIAARYFIIIFTFVLGAFIGGMFTSMIGVKAVWIAGGVLVIPVILFQVFEQE
ncbi:YoaK family protein [Anaerocolumna sp. AGMB13025]|uniref:YoaK family protein n=1 Tax=Anaerocolumna sp. AGMB13025 TaxID=3039116 RepID=UPI00241F1F54|nr:YoaK family protein [Anaerocolumna sp. AGMB13025]WFR56672.1 YoaK family protein [Anaerocolumna sp. AGMB13025]